MVYRFLVFCLLPILIGSCGGGQKANVLKLAHGLDPSHPVHQAMVFMADRCKELSNGDLQIEIYPSGQLGSEQQYVELLQLGSLAISKVSSAVLEGFNDDFKALGMPYIFHSREHSFKVLDGPTGKKLLASCEPYLLKGLGFYDAGSRSFYTLNRPINHPDDLRGLKIRVMKSVISFNLVRMLGAAPTPTDWGELYTALQSGVVDGAENNPPSFFTSRHYEVCKYYSLNEHTFLPDVLVMSLIVWNKLTEKEKEWLQQAIAESVAVQRELWAKSEQESLQKVIEAGVIVNYPDKKPFAEKAAGVYDMFKEQSDVYNLIKEIQTIN